MKAFTYKSARSEEEAVKALGPGALPLAGGTTLLNLMKERVVEPDVLVNLKSIKGFDRIETVSDGHRIGAGGAREIPLEKFFALPKDNVLKENVLANNEIVTHVSIGKGNAKSATYTVLHKESHDWPVALAAVTLEMNGETCVSARIVLGA